ncbi:hypothetical protein CEXT_154481 [Caerostris extrusa]|uniref:Uncharacterized protein n=1 Tax=Caerostris extrusa TaxID=172846 RepID=A0AAV4Y582_CAEEX|nr:hypothetical protein CEXT_154481 [Caerostris extrusa]
MEGLLEWRSENSNCQLVYGLWSTHVGKYPLNLLAGIFVIVLLQKLGKAAWDLAPHLLSTGDSNPPPPHPLQVF